MKTKKFRTKNSTIQVPVLKGKLEAKFIAFIDSKCQPTGSVYFKLDNPSDRDYFVHRTVAEKFFGKINWKIPTEAESDYKESDGQFTCVKVYLRSHRQFVDILLLSDEEFGVHKFATRMMKELCKKGRDVLSIKDNRVFIYQALKASKRIEQGREAAFDDPRREGHAWYDAAEVNYPYDEPRFDPDNDVFNVSDESLDDIPF